MTTGKAPEERRWLKLLRPGDLVAVAQGVGEPTVLLEQLLAAGAVLPDIEVFVGLSHSGALSSLPANRPELLSFGAMGPLAGLAETGEVGVIPCNFVDVPRALRARRASRLVLLVQVAPADGHGQHSLGMAVDYTYELLGEAALVVAEVNDQLPVTSAPTITTRRIDAAVRTSRPLPEVPARAAFPAQERIAAHVAGLVADGATLQLGIGRLASAVGAQLVGRRDLRVRSPLAGDWLLTLANAGALSCGADAVTVCEAAGSRALYAFIAGGGATVRPVKHLNGAEHGSVGDALVAVNSALQVDLSGQVNAEQAAGRYVGGIGGQADALRAAQRSPQGCSVIMLPAETTDGRSRIVSRLDAGTVTSGRALVDFVVTEHGVAALRGRTLTERAAAIVAVAAPGHRAALTGSSRKVSTP